MPHILPCPFCEGEAAPFDENDHTYCTTVWCGSTAYMHVDAWNNRPMMGALSRIAELEAELGGWNADMSIAPKGKTVTCSLMTKDGPREFKSYEPDHVILMSECRKVIKSYWLPKENRWAGFSEKSRPLAWQPWPEWDEQTAAHVIELRTLEAEE